MRKELVPILVLSVFTIVSVSLFWGDSVPLSIVLAAISVLMLHVEKKKGVVPFYFAVFVSGAVAESFAILFGPWNYAKPDAFGIPIWLPFVWGNAGLFIRVLYLEIMN